MYICNLKSKLVSMNSKSNLKKREEIFNSVSHGLGIPLSIAALVLMIIFAAIYGNAWHIVSVIIYGVSLIVLYSASTLYHGAKRLKRKWYLNLFDHSAIFVLIAGTYTPFTLITLRGPWGWSIFGVIWGLTIIGIVFKLFFYSHKYRKISAIIYILMGWICIIAIKPLTENLELEGLLWLFIGGVIYSLGVIFYLWKKLPFAHGVFHIFVLLGSIAHFISIFFYVLPR